METLKKLAGVLWSQHRKKLLAFLLGLLLAAIAKFGGIPLSEVKEAAQEAVDKTQVEQVQIPAVQPAEESK